MEQSPQPNDIAREVIKRLAMRKQPPTPENFRRTYLEVQGGEPTKPLWPETIRSLLTQWEAYQTGLTQAKKRDMLDRVLINFGNDSEQLAAKLASLVRSWSESGASAAALDSSVETPVSPAQTTTPSAVVTSQEAAQVAPTSHVGQVIGGYLEDISGGCRDLWPDLAKQGETLARRIAERAYVVEERDVEALGRLWREMLVRAEDDHEFIGGLRRVMSLLFANIGELVSDDAWLSGQMATMQAALSDHMNPSALFQAEESLKDLVLKQKQIKGGLNEAKEKLKQLVSTFISRLGDMSESTGQYNTRIKSYSARIAAAEDISELGEVIDSLSSDMGQMEEDMARNHRELVDARSHAVEAEARIVALERELEEVSNMVREDQLTGTLNRRGMDEAFKRELARVGRMASPFSIGLLDIDHFKRLNDTHGHQVGDQALVHLASVVKELLRSTDSVARYGGEEFLLLLPNSDLDDAEKVMLRLQRELTKQFFLHDNKKVLITFSAGVAQLASDETQDGLLKRADEAMYKAKAAGRNRVERG